MHCGFERGRGSGRGLGFGFRGASPPWPYVARGRGGWPRCGYFSDIVTASPPPVQGSHFYGPATANPEYVPYAAPAGEEEIGYLRDQAEAIRTELEGIESRMRNLEGR